MRPLISILFPCYNAEKYLPYSLESILNQDYTNLQVICINDGSTDGTLRLLQDYCTADTRIEILDLQQNRGLIESLNRGIDLVRGQYFARMDADDYCPPDRISIQMDYIQKHPEFDLVSGGYHYFIQNNRPLEYLPPVALRPAALRFISLFSTPLTHAAVLGKSTLLHGMYWYDKNYPHSEDYELFSRLALEKVPMANIPTSLYWVRLNPDSVSVRHNDQQVRSHLSIAQRNISQHFGPAHHINEALLRVISNRLNHPVSITTMRDGLLLIDRFFDLEIAGEKLSSAEIREIRAYLILHKVNIIIQSNKVNFSALGRRSFPFFLKSLLLLKTSYIRIIWQKFLIYIKFRML